MFLAKISTAVSQPHSRGSPNYCKLVFMLPELARFARSTWMQEAQVEIMAKNMCQCCCFERICKFSYLIIKICWHKTARPMIQVGRQKFIITRTSSEFKILGFVTFHFIRDAFSAACSHKYLVNQPHSSNSVHWDMYTWARQPAEDQTGPQSEEERYGCWFIDPLIDVVNHTANMCLNLLQLQKYHWNLTAMPLGLVFILLETDVYDLSKIISIHN